MTACAALAEGKRIARQRVENHGGGLHVVQIAGCEARWMAEGARIAEDAGAAVIDINMGCPAKHVTNGASGSALMRDLDHALTLIEAVVQAVEVPVTLKMRLGWDDRSRNAPNACAARRRCRRAACDSAWPHPLPILQRPRRLGRGARRQSSGHIPVVVNGDIESFDDADRGARGLAGRRGDGRPRRARPAVVSRPARALSRDRQRASRRRVQRATRARSALYVDMLAHYGRALGLRHARKHLGWALDAAAAAAGVPTMRAKPSAAAC